MYVVDVGFVHVALAWEIPLTGSERRPSATGEVRRCVR